MGKDKKEEAMQDDRLRAKGSLALSMLIFGTIGIFRRWLPLPSGFLAMARGAIGALFLLLMLLLRGRRISLRAIGRKRGLLLLSGGMIGVNWILLFEAYRFTTVAKATLCYYMAPVFVLVASPLLLRERPGVRQTVCAAAALIGMVPVSGVFSAERGVNDLPGILLALGAAIFYAGVILLGRCFDGIPAYDKTVIQLGAAALVILPYTLLAEDLRGITFTLPLVGMLLLVGVLHTGIAYALYFSAMHRLSAQTVALFGYIDPVAAVLLSSLLLAERLDGPTALGTVLILGATLLSDKGKAKK